MSSNHVSRGSTLHRSKGNVCGRKTEKMKEEEARAKVIDILGEERVRKLKQKICLLPSKKW